MGGGVEGQQLHLTTRGRTASSQRGRSFTDTGAGKVRSPGLSALGRVAVRLRLRPEVHIVGADTDEARRMMKPLQMRLLGGKRELLHAGSRAIPKEIRGTKIEEDEEE